MAKVTTRVVLEESEIKAALVDLAKVKAGLQGSNSATLKMRSKGGDLPDSSEVAVATAEIEFQMTEARK